MKSKNLTEIIFCCIVMLFLAVLLVMSRGLPPNSARLPILIGGITLTLAAVQLVINIKEKASMGKNSAEDRPFVAKEMIIKVGVTGLFMVLTLVLWYLLGSGSTDLKYASGSLSWRAQMACDRPELRYFGGGSVFPVLRAIVRSPAQGSFVRRALVKMISE